LTFGKKFSGDVLGANRIRMLNRDKIFPIVNDTGAFVVDGTGNAARILVEEGLFDIEGDNGVIHAIDQVLLPPEFGTNQDDDEIDDDD